MRIEPSVRAHHQILPAFRKLRRAEVHHGQISDIHFVAGRIVACVRHDSNDCE